MNRFKARRLESIDLGLCPYSGCNRKLSPGRVLCAFHLKKESARNKKRREADRLRAFGPFVWVDGSGLSRM